MAVYGMIQVALSVELNQAHRWFVANMFRNDHERNRERVHSELYSLGVCVMQCGETICT